MEELICQLCWEKVKRGEECYNIYDNIVCKKCKKVNVNQTKQVEKILCNIYNNWYYWEQIWEWEWRIIYDLENIIDLPIVLKYKKNTKHEWLGSQCFVENFIYNKIWEQYSIFAKIYNSDKVSDHTVFMEKCNILDETLFNLFDIRDEETYKKYILNNNKIDIKLLKEDIYHELKNNLANPFFFKDFDGIDIEEIPNKEDLLEISLYFQMIDFDNLMEEIEDQYINGKIITENNYINTLIPKVFKELSDKFNFSGYDLSLGSQWGISKIDNSFRLVDYGDWINSEKVEEYISNNFS